MTYRETPFACDMTAIAPEQPGAHIPTIERLFRSAKGMRELPNGYALELPNDPDALLTAPSSSHLSVARNIPLEFEQPKDRSEPHFCRGPKSRVTVGPAVIQPSAGAVRKARGQD
jgi:hypothetical protein